MVAERGVGVTVGSNGDSTGVRAEEEEDEGKCRGIPGLPGARG